MNVRGDQARGKGHNTNPTAPATAAGQQIQLESNDCNAVSSSIHNLKRGAVIAATFENESGDSDVVDWGHAIVLETPSAPQRKLRAHWLDYDNEDTDELCKELTEHVVKFGLSEILCEVLVAKQCEGKHLIPESFNPLEASQALQ